MPAVPPDRTETNPFRPPNDLVGDWDLGPIPDAAALRRACLTRESKIRLLGLFAQLAAALTCGLALAYLNELLGARPPTLRLFPTGLSLSPARVPVAWIFGVAGLLWLIGSGLRRLDPWPRWAAIAVAGWSFLTNLIRYLQPLVLGGSYIGRPGVLLGTLGGLLASGSVLMVLLPRASGRVFSLTYQAVVRQTPEIRPRFSIIANVAQLAIAGVVAYIVLVQIRSALTAIAIGMLHR